MSYVTRYESSLVRIRQTWPGDFKAYKPFGSGYTFALGDSITNANVSAETVVDDGAEEYLTFFGTYTQVAARHGLVPDPHFEWDPAIAGGSTHGRPNGGLAERPAGDKHKAFRMFAPRYDAALPQGEELTKVSRLYAAFAFIKQPQEERPSKRQRSPTG